MSLLNVLKHPSEKAMTELGASCTHTARYQTPLFPPISSAIEQLQALTNTCIATHLFPSLQQSSATSIHCHTSDQRLVCKEGDAGPLFSLAIEAVESVKRIIIQTGGDWRPKVTARCSFSDSPDATLTLISDRVKGVSFFTLATKQSQDSTVFTTELDVRKHTFAVHTDGNRTAIHEFFLHRGVDCRMPDKLSLCGNATEIERDRIVALPILFGTALLLGPFAK